MDVAFSSACSGNLVTRALHDHRICVLNHLADGVLSEIGENFSNFLEDSKSFKRTLQKLCVLRNVHSPTFEVVVHFRSGDEKASVDVQMHDMCTVQTSVVVDNVAS